MKVDTDFSYTSSNTHFYFKKHSKFGNVSVRQTVKLTRSSDLKPEPEFIVRKYLNEKAVNI